MSNDETPTLAERYSRAVRSTRLVVQERFRGDVDMLIAAGWTASSYDEDGQPITPDAQVKRSQLAVALHRLASEFDSVRARVHGSSSLNITEALLVLSELKSLPDVRQRFGHHATVYATRWQFMRPDAEVAKVAGRVLDAWLDPICRRCEGAGVTGLLGGPQPMCRACGGSGRSQRSVGADHEERQFAGRLLADMDYMVSDVEAGMRMFLRQRE